MIRIRLNVRVNDRIRIKEVMVVDQDGTQLGVLPTEEALKRAQDAGMDLVEVAPNSRPPVCRIMDYGKWLYEQKRKVRDAHKKSHHVSLKEIRLRPETDKHDLQIKMNHARQFLEKGHRVQFTIMFRGRQMMHTDRGYAKMDEIVEAMEDLAKVERPGKIASRRMTLVLIPK